MIEPGYLRDEELDVDPEGISPELQHRMGIHACRYANKQDDPHSVAAELLDMLGLRGEDPGDTCRVCGGVLSRRALSDRGKYRRTCGDVCRRKFLGGAE